MPSEIPLLQAKECSPRHPKHIPKSALPVILDLLVIVHDVRTGNRLTHSLKGILFLAIAATISGVNSIRGMALWGDNHQKWLEKYLPYEGSMPSADTIGRVLSLIKKEELEELLGQAVESIKNAKLKKAKRIQAAIDGKVCVRSVTIEDQQTKRTEGGRQAYKVVNLCLTGDYLTIGMDEVLETEGEIDAAVRVLEKIDLNKLVVSGDAGFCYLAVIQAIRKSRGRYFLRVKGNQPSLLKSIETEFSKTGELSKETTVSKGHGRNETRVTRVRSAASLPKMIREHFPNIQRIVEVRTLRTHTKKGKKDQEGVMYYIWDESKDAKRASELSLDHWKIVEVGHWHLDVNMGEDDSTADKEKCAPQLAIIRRLCLSKLMNNGDDKHGVKARLAKCSWSTDYLEMTLGLS